MYSWKWVDSTASRFLIQGCTNTVLDGMEFSSRPSRTRINFFSLDVEGSELKVLETFDFDKVKIDVLIVETDFIHNQGNVGGQIDAKVEAVRKLVESRSNLKRVPSQFKDGEDDSLLCKRGQSDGCYLLCIDGSDVFVSPELYEYDTKPWTFVGEDFKVEAE